VNEELKVQNLHVKDIKYPPVVLMNRYFYAAFSVHVLLTLLSHTYHTCYFRNGVKMFLLRVHRRNLAVDGL
jgi:hypothetical protein